MSTLVRLPHTCSFENILTGASKAGWLLPLVWALAMADTNRRIAVSQTTRSSIWRIAKAGFIGLSLNGACRFSLTLKDASGHPSTQKDLSVPLAAISL